MRGRKKIKEVRMFKCYSIILLPAEYLRIKRGRETRIEVENVTEEGSNGRWQTLEKNEQNIQRKRLETNQAFEQLNNEIKRNNQAKEENNNLKEWREKREKGDKSGAKEGKERGGSI